MLGTIVCAQAVADGITDELAGFAAVDDATFTVRLDRPHADFLWLLADPVASVLKRANAETWASEGTWSVGYLLPDFPELPVGTGPFRVTAMDLLADDVALEPNPFYWDAPPTLDYIVYDFFDGSVDTTSDWLEGAYDNDVFPYNLCESFSTLGDATSNGIPV